MVRAPSWASQRATWRIQHDALPTQRVTRTKSRRRVSPQRDYAKSLARRFEAAASASLRAACTTASRLCIFLGSTYPRLCEASHSRGFCPSCTGRRMNATAANLIERVLPPQSGLRQWVLSFPFSWRRRLAQDGALLGRLTRIAVETVLTFYAARAAEQADRSDVVPSRWSHRPRPGTRREAERPRRLRPKSCCAPCAPCPSWRSMIPRAVVGRGAPTFPPHGLASRTAS